ncbi:hypothetical protein [Halorussus halobius]|uniref:hypothetical protein n=1 Tax=Halorussus halobius TaxID=1710537 RepID=UPI00143D9760|nr:hypothetical protein [Halorussus halobius]
MESPLRALASVVIAAFVGFSLAFLFAPDPTGVVPILAGAGLAAVLSPFVYRRL